MDQSRRKNSENKTSHKIPKKKDKTRSSYRTFYNNPEIYYEPVSEFSVRQFNSHGTRLYPTMSDSAVCGYSFPSDYPLNRGFSVYPVMSANMYSVGFENFPQLSRIGEKNKIPDVECAVNNNSNFTSLPPVNTEEADCNQKRRFSDPGLNNADESNESSDESISDDCSVLNEPIMDQISDLKSENKRLFSELESTRNELKTVKSELAVITNKVTCHEPFTLAQMVKEIRDAAEVRENILMSKVERLIENCLNPKKMTNMVGEIDSLNKRLSLLERQLEHLRIHSKVDSKINGEATVEEIDNGAKRKNETVEKIAKFTNDSDYTKENGSNSNHQLDIHLENAETNSDYNGNSLSTISCESLSSSLGPGSLHSATVTLCGPVTDL